MVRSAVCATAPSRASHTRAAVKISRNMRMVMGRVLSRIFLPIMGGRGKRHKGLKGGAARHVKSAVTGSLPFWAGSEANILEQHEEMPRVGWRWHKAEMLIEGYS